MTLPALAYIDKLSDFCNQSGIVARKNVSGAELTTFAIGGPISVLIEPKNLTELQLALGRCAELGLAVKFIGFGSNILMPDLGCPMPIVRLGHEFRSVEVLSDNCFRVGAGASLMTLSRNLSEDGFSGLEFAGGIPASLGGAVKMNAGAHGTEIGELVQEVQAMTAEGQIVTLTRDELAFSYRHCPIPDDLVICSAMLKLSRGDRERTAELRSTYLAERRRRQPLTLPCAGSIFRNPSVTLPAGKLLEEVGLKGSVLGGAKVSELHANWIVNPERTATAGDVQGLIERCQTATSAARGVELLTELVIW